MLHHLAVPLRGVEALEYAGEEVQLQTPQVLLQEEWRRNVAFTETFNVIPALSCDVEVKSNG